MKNISIHPASAVVGACALGLVLLAAGALQVPPRVSVVNAVEVKGLPRLDQVVAIPLDTESAPFVVPDGRWLLIQSFIVVQQSCQFDPVRLALDGVEQVGVSASPGILVAEGAVVSISLTEVVPPIGDCPTHTAEAVVRGYLVDA